MGIERRILKTCTKCQKIKFEAGFRFIKRINNFLGHCKACEYKEQREWTLKNKDKANASKKKWAINNPEYMTAKRKADRITYKESHRIKTKKWKGENRERLNEYLKDWLKANPGKAYSYIRERRMVQSHATPSWADGELMELVYAEARHRGMEVDHIVPLKGENVCGLHVYYNTQLLSHSENSSKGNRFRWA